MAVVKVPLLDNVYSNIDKTLHNDSNSEFFNGYTDQKGGTVSFPGQITKSYGAIHVGRDLDNSIDGMFYIPESTINNVLIAKMNESLVPGYLKTDGSFYFDFNTFSSSSTLPLGRTYFQEGSSYLFMAIHGDNKLYYGDLSLGFYPQTPVSSFTTAFGSDFKVTGLAWMDGYILISDEEFCYFSEVADGLTYNALNYFSTPGNPDKITTMKVYNREILLFGENSIEIWANDGVNPFSRTPNGLLPIGTIEPDSVVTSPEGVFFLSTDKRIGRLFNGDVAYLPTGYDAELENLNTSKTSFHRIKIKGEVFLICNFPNGDFSLLYNLNTEMWSKLGEYQGAGESYFAYDMNSYLYIPEYSMHLIGKNKTAGVFLLDENVSGYKREYGNNEAIPEVFDRYQSNTLRLRRLSGHISYGTNDPKQCNKLTLRLKRGHTGVGRPVMYLRWNDDNKGFSNQLEIDLGETGDMEIVREVYPFGVYRTRQYEVVFSEGVKFVMGDAEEDIEVLMS